MAALHENRVRLVIATDKAGNLITAFALLGRLVFFRELGEVLVKDLC